ncbi:MAG: polymer-forming cytoskeletal protein [Chloroflexi bacterium]|nr:polymer-forming cytoskeletal protein [Chloroflexota bacterium]
MRSSRILLIALILFIVGGAAATEVMQATTCTVEADEVVDGTLFAVCRDLTIDGRVNGSVIAAALTVRINGTVADDLYLLARSVDISGTLEDDVHAVAGSIRMLAGSAIHDGALRRSARRFRWRTACGSTVTFRSPRCEWNTTVMRSAI